MTHRIISLFILFVLTAICINSSLANEPQFVKYPQSAVRTLQVGRGNDPLVLLHGYGSKPQEWLPFTKTIHLPKTKFFVFPEGIEETVPPDGPRGGRGWWRLDLASYIKPGSPIPDLSKAEPAGLKVSSNRIQTLIHEVEKRVGSSPKNLILGGFSQGGMVASEIAFKTDEPIQALILLSGTTVDEVEWIKAMPNRRNLPVFISHGRNDNVLSFDIANRYQQEMRIAGLNVTWVPFEGGHEIPMEVVNALNTFLARLERH
jgi:phospholipase/carboxylesterase